MRRPRRTKEYNWYSILVKEKRNRKEKKRDGLRACKPLYAPSAQDKTIYQVFYIGEEKRNK